MSHFLKVIQLLLLGFGIQLYHIEKIILLLSVFYTFSARIG